MRALRAIPAPGGRRGLGSTSTHRAVEDLAGGMAQVAAALRALADSLDAIGAAETRDRSAGDALVPLLRVVEEIVPLPADPRGLTGRERAVLALLVAGRSNREIGSALGISPKTAGVHVGNILGKLGVRGRVEASVVALRTGLVLAESAPS